MPTINAGEPPASSLALAVGAAAAAAAGGSRAAGMQAGDGSASSDSSAAASTQDNVAQEDEVAISGATLAPGGDPAPMCLEAQQHLGQPDAQRAVDAWHRPAWHVFKAVATANGVAVQCLACPTQKNGQTKFFKFGPFGNAKSTGPFDVGRFVATHLRTPSHQRNWDARAVRVGLEMRGLPPGPPTAPQAQRVIPLPETHLQVMSRTHNADFNITATVWSCRRCGKQGVFNSSTTSGTLSSHRGSKDCSTKRPQRALATRLRQFLVVSEAVQAARQTELRFPTGSAVRVKLPGGRFCRATVVRTRGGMVVAALESNSFATVSAVASAVELEPPSACHGMWVPILQLPNNGGRVDLRAVGAIIPEVTDGDLRIAFTTAVRPLSVPGVGLVASTFFDTTSCGGEQLSPAGAAYPWTCDFCRRIATNGNFVKAANKANMRAAQEGIHRDVNISKMNAVELRQALAAARQAAKGMTRTIQRWSTTREKEKDKKAFDASLACGNFACVVVFHSGRVRACACVLCNNACSASRLVVSLVLCVLAGAWSAIFVAWPATTRGRTARSKRTRRAL